jgi:hypothetical protein
VTAHDVLTAALGDPDTATRAITALINNNFSIVQDAETWIEFGYCNGAHMIKTGRQLPADHQHFPAPWSVRTCTAGPWHQLRGEPQRVQAIRAQLRQEH